MSLTPSTMLPLGTKAPRLPPARHEREDRLAGRFRQAQGAAGDVHLQPLPLRQARAPRAGPARPRLPGQRASPSSASTPTTRRSIPTTARRRWRRKPHRPGYTFPYLYDESQEVAKAYRAACTPDFFLFDANQRLVYRGQFDDSRPGNGMPVTGNDLRAALDAVLAGKPGPREQKPSIGCNIKWKPGNEPDYFHVKA